MKTLPFVTIFAACFLQACAFEGSDLRDPEIADDALSEPVTSETTMPIRDLQPVSLERELVTNLWRPRSHPPGTLLIDRYRDLWMVETWPERRIIPGTEVLEEAGLGHLDPIRMTIEEEACLTIVDDDDYWYPEIVNWQPFFGPNEEEEVYVVDRIRHLRRETFIEALVSYGIRPSDVRPFDEGPEAWDSFRDMEPRLSFRDGSVVRTELATYYMLYGRAYAFQPQSLAEDAGYRAEGMMHLMEARLRQLARATTAFTRETFDMCPAMEAI